LVLKKKCLKCGAKNYNNADFCAECGEKLDKKPLDRAVSSWKKQSNGTKVISSVIGCCFGIVIFLVLIALIFPTTALSIDNTTIDIDNQTTTYVLKGTTDANATVKISSQALNLTNVEANVGDDGKFEYTLPIPLDVTELELDVVAKAEGKSQSYENITIKRPLTPLTVDQPPTINYDQNKINITGKTDPNTEIIIASSDLNINSVKITSDRNGNFTTSINVPLDKSVAKITITAKAVGKRNNNQTIDISRASATTDVSDSTTPSATTSSDSNSGSSSSTSDSTSSSSSNTAGTFVGSVNSNVYHYPWCASAKRIKSYNLITFSSVQDAKNANYRPCLKCSPPG
jgi:ribosomal protein L37E